MRAVIMLIFSSKFFSWMIYAIEPLDQSTAAIYFKTQCTYF